MPDTMIELVLDGEYADLQEKMESVVAKKLYNRIEDAKAEVLAEVNGISVEEQRSRLNEAKSSKETKKYSLKELKEAVADAWGDMDTQKGRWYRDNAPKKLVSQATNEAINEHKGKLSDAMTENQFNDLVFKIHKQVFKAVGVEGKKSEWEDKWGNE